MQDLESALSMFLRPADGTQSGSSLYFYFLLSLRVGVVLSMTPVLLAMPAPLRIRVLLVAALSGVLALGFGVTGPAVPADLGGLLASGMAELALGATLGLGVLLAFAGFSFAGSLLDVQIGFGIAQVLDPATQRPVPLLSSVFSLVGVLVFFLVNGHHALLRGIAYSVEAFPVGAAWSPALAAGPVLKLVTSLFALGFALAAPVVFCVLLVELALGVVARSLPQLNMFSFGIPVKIVVGLAALTLWFSAAIGGTMDRLYGSIFNTWNDMFLAAKTSRATNPGAEPGQRPGVR
jgi:flagellar biosynthetic protein FliR